MNISLYVEEIEAIRNQIGEEAIFYLVTLQVERLSKNMQLSIQRMLKV